MKRTKTKIKLINRIKNSSLINLIIVSGLVLSSIVCIVYLIIVICMVIEFNRELTLDDDMVTQYNHLFMEDKMILNIDKFIIEK